MWRFNKSRAALLICFLAVFALSSCGMLQDKFGRKKGTTDLVINVPQNSSPHLMAGWPNLFGGMMIYIVGVNGNPFATTIPLNLAAGEVTASAEITIPNGPYMIYMVAWDGNGVAGYPLNGQAGCGYTDDGVHNFTGGTQVVDFVVSQAGCNFAGASVFSDAGTGFLSSSTNFGTISVAACQNADTSANCSSGSNASATYGSTGSVKVVMEGYVRDGNGIHFQPAFRLPGTCTAISGGLAATNNRIPAGSSTISDKYMAVSFLFYPNGNSTCTGAPGMIVHFPKGIVNGTVEKPFAITQAAGSYTVSFDLGL